MKNTFVTVLLILVSQCWADANQIRHLFESIASSSPSNALPTPDRISSQLTAIGALPASEVASLLPLAKQCLLSSDLEVRRAGLMLFFSAALRIDSVKLIEPYAVDLGVVASDPASPLSQGALSILAMTATRPGMPAKTIGVLLARLEDKPHSNQEMLTIAASLLEASPSDPAMVGKVLRAVEEQSEVSTTVGILGQLGLMKTRNPGALSFIGRNLDSANRFNHEAALEAVSRLDRDTRTRFAAQLGRIAADHTEPQHLRTQAAEALR